MVVLRTNLNICVKEGENDSLSKTLLLDFAVLTGEAIVSKWERFLKGR